MTPGNYILGRAKQMGLSVTQLAGLLHMTYPTLRQKLIGKSDWHSSEIKALADHLKFSAEEIYALTVDKSIPDKVSTRSADRAWSKGHDGYPLDDDPAFIPFYNQK